MNEWMNLIEKYSERYNVPFTKAQKAFCVSVLEEATILGGDTKKFIDNGNLYGDIYIPKRRWHPFFAFRIDYTELNTVRIKAVVYRKLMKDRHLTDNQNVIISDMRKFIEEMKIEEIECRKSLIDSL